MKKRVIELRSDTFTKPTQEMVAAMMSAEVGDDVYREDPTVNDLEALAAALFGKESAIFMPSGTMSNLASIMAHSVGRGEEVLVGDRSHISIFEQGGASTIAGVFPRFLANKDDGSFAIDELKRKISSGRNIHSARTSIVCLESTHNWCHGSPLSTAFVEEVSGIAHSSGLKVHMDGARIFNASVKLGLPVASIVKECDSVACCLSKGLCCPVGSVLAGNKEFVERVRRARKVLGGGMRQAGYLAAAGVLALKTMVDRLRDDHERAYTLARAIAGAASDVVFVDMDKVHTNILFVRTNPSKITAQQISQALEKEFVTEDGVAVSIKTMCVDDSTIRMVTHKDVSDADINLVVRRIKSFIDSIDSCCIS